MFTNMLADCGGSASVRIAALKARHSDNASGTFTDPVDWGLLGPNTPGMGRRGSDVQLSVSIT